MTRRSRRIPDLFPAVLLAVCLVLGFFVLAVPPAGADGPLKTDSDARRVHTINLRDAQDELIGPTDSNPYLPKFTCGKSSCHDYQSISTGWHFNAPDPNVPPGRPGEPWILADARTGTQLPISSRRWSGTYRPNQIGLTSWEFVKRFGRHMPGGGLGETRPKTPREDDDPNARWAVSGNLAIDCMTCHSADNRHDPVQRARQIKDENLNFRWIPTVAAGLGSIHGSAAAVSKEYDPEMQPDPPENWPKVKYNAARFDTNDRVFFDVTRRPAASRCAFCHTSRAVDIKTPPRWQAQPDVHLGAGMTCTDCHSNGLDHNIVRGYEGEAAERNEPLLAQFSCQGCHDAGRRGSPKPQHVGLPPVHFKKLSCTACHSGPLPERPGRVQTSMAHRLGIESEERDRNTLPLLTAPIYRRLSNGKIAPHKILWPAFWGRMKDGAITPILPDAVAKTAGKTLDRGTKPLDTKIVEATLRSLAKQDTESGEPVYVAGGRLYRLDNEGLLAASEHPASKPYAWPLAHDVRPARQALGARGCGDCHAEDSPFFFGSVKVESPFKPDEASNTVPIYDFGETGRSYIQAFARALAYRPIFKIASLAAAGLMLILLPGALLTLIRGQRPGATQEPRAPSLWERLVLLAALAVTLVLSWTGFSAILGSDEPMTGLPLLVHNGAAGLFAGLLALLALCWTRRFAFAGHAWAKALAFLTMAAGAVTIVSIVVLMYPLIPAGEMETWVLVHRYSSLVTGLAVVGWLLPTLRRAHQAKSPS